MLLQAEYDCLVKLFGSLPHNLPEAPSNSKLPPLIDLDFFGDEGAWPAFNKAMHAAFGDKSKGLTITEHGKGLDATLKVI